MTSLRFEDVLPDARLALALTRARPSVAPLRGPDLESAVRAAAARELPRAALVAAVGADLADAPPEAVAAAERLRTPGSVVVVAGQQPGLLGGPAMVLLKALAAVALARRIEERFSVPAVPVFWHASEDHDHGEADHVSVLGPGGLERLQVPLPGDRSMLSSVTVPPEAAEVARRALELLPDGAGLAALRGVLPPRPGDTLGSWCRRILTSLLGPLGVLVVEPDALRNAGLSVVEHELGRPGELAASIGRAEAATIAAGFAAPLGLPRRELFFLVEGARRVRVALDGDGDGDYETETGGRGRIAELLEGLRSRPADFSWNVAGRVLAQDVALPVAAQICGPSELGYVSLLREAHALLGVPQPAAILRPGVTFVSRRAARACRRLGVEPADVVRDGAAAFEGHGCYPDATAAALDDLAEGVRALPAGRTPAVRRRVEAIQRELGLYGAALERERAEADTVRAGRLRTALEELRPRTRLQERVLSPLAWLAGHGPGLLERVLDAFADPDAEHVLLDLEAAAAGKESDA